MPSFWLPEGILKTWIVMKDDRIIDLERIPVFYHFPLFLLNAVAEFPVA